jgi:hypothetical protein
MLPFVLSQAQYAKYDQLNNCLILRTLSAYIRAQNLSLANVSTSLAFHPNLAEATNSRSKSRSSIPARLSQRPYTLSHGRPDTSHFMSPYALKGPIISFPLAMNNKENHHQSELTAASTTKTVVTSLRMINKTARGQMASDENQGGMRGRRD